MRFKLKYEGRVISNGSYCDVYKLNNISIGVSKENFSSEFQKNVEKGKEVLMISFSCMKKIPTKEEINRILKYFNFDTSKPYHSYIKDTHDFINNSNVDIIYYEQIQEQKET